MIRMITMIPMITMITMIHLARTRRVSASVLGLLLALSLLFNVFFAVGYLKARNQLAQNDPAERVPRLVADELKLDEGQAEVYRRLRSDMSDEDAVLRDGIALVRQEMLDELNGEEPNLERLRTLAVKEAELHRQRRLAGSERFREFVGMLEPDQRERLSRRFHRGRRGRGPGRDIMRRFDENQDGTLDDTEKAAFHEFVEERERERENRRKERMARFDVNGDGELDEAERQALREHLREQGHGEFRPGGGRGGRGGWPGGRSGGRPGGPPGDRLGDPPVEEPDR